jgi:hypothetical protein
MIAFNADEYPLVLLDMGGSDRTVDDVRRMIASFGMVNERARRSKTRYVVIGRTQQHPTAQERRAIAEEANRFSAEDRALCDAAVIVVPNSVLRGVMTALGWLMPSFGAIIELAPSTDRAVDQALARLRAMGLEADVEKGRRASRWFRLLPGAAETASSRSG